MGGGLMQLVAYGAQDIYLTGNPQITFFKVVYRRHTNFSIESIEQTWSGNHNTNGRCTSVISRNGDLIYKMYLEVKSDSFNNNGGALAEMKGNPGSGWIQSVDVEIGGQLIDRHTGKWMETYAELTEKNPSGTTAAIDNNIKYGTLFQRMSYMGGVNGFQSQQPVGAAVAVADPAVGVEKDTQASLTDTIYIPLQFWFCRNPGLALPLIALQYHEVKVVLNHKIKDIFSQNSTNRLWCDYIYLDTDERRRFAQVSHEYLIEQLQIQENLSAKSLLNFNHPVKELILTNSDLSLSEVTYAPNSEDHPLSMISSGFQAPTAVQDTTVNHFNTQDPDLFNILLKMNGHDRFEERTGRYFTNLQLYDYHSGNSGYSLVPTRVKKQNSAGLNVLSQDSMHRSFISRGDNRGNIKSKISVYSFALKPEEHQPSGTCNFSRIDTVDLKLDTTIDNKVLVDTCYAVNYNVLRIMSGMGGLAYSN